MATYIAVQYMASNEVNMTLGKDIKDNLITNSGKFKYRKSRLKIVTLLYHQFIFNWRPVTPVFASSWGAHLIASAPGTKNPSYTTGRNYLCARKNLWDNYNATVWRPDAFALSRALTSSKQHITSCCSIDGKRPHHCCQLANNCGSCRTFPILHNRPAIRHPYDRHMAH